MRKKSLGLILFLGGTCGPLMSAEASIPKVKVRIAKSIGKVAISGYDLKRYLWPTQSMKEFAGLKKIQFNCRSNKIRKANKPIKLATVNSLTGLVNLGQDRFKGQLHVQTSEDLKGCDVINELSLEDYLATLLPKEMNTHWPIEALKAQAVAARSYAYHLYKSKQVSRTKGYSTYYDLENSEKHQVNGSFFDVTKKTIAATKQTNGEVLTFENKRPVPVFFHSKCGGKTLRPEQVWSNKVAGYQGVECPYCHEHGTKNWKRKIKKGAFANYLGKAMSRYANDKSYRKQYEINVLDDKKGSSFIKFYQENDFKFIKKSRMRGMMGRETLPSNYFTLTQKGDYIHVSGAGFGHGVGMCQFGAKEMALQGYNYKQILKHYFPKLKISNIY